MTQNTQSSATQSAALSNPAETSKAVAQAIWPLEERAENSPLFAQRTPNVVSEEKLAEALGGKARKLGAESWAKAGDLVGSRLNLNVLKATGIAAQTIHRGNAGGGHQKNRGFWKGRALGYCGAVEISNAFFNVSQTAREQIATGEISKTPMASVDGRFVTERPQDFSGVEVSFNPKKSHLFVDSTGRALRFAELAVVCGHRVFVRGRLVWHDEASAPQRAGEAPSAAQVRPGRDSEQLGPFDPQAFERLAQSKPARASATTSASDAAGGDAGAGKVVKEKRAKAAK